MARNQHDSYGEKNVPIEEPVGIDKDFLLSGYPPYGFDSDPET